MQTLKKDTKNVSGKASVCDFRICEIQVPKNSFVAAML